jgi:hypothetical protein
LSFYDGVGVLKIEESESEVLCNDSTALITGAPKRRGCQAAAPTPKSEIKKKKENQNTNFVDIMISKV